MVEVKYWTESKRASGSVAGTGTKYGSQPPALQTLLVSNPTSFYLVKSFAWLPILESHAGGWRQPSQWGGTCPAKVKLRWPAEALPKYVAPSQSKHWSLFLGSRHPQSLWTFWWFVHASSFSEMRRLWFALLSGIHCKIQNEKAVCLPKCSREGLLRKRPW